MTLTAAEDTLDRVFQFARDIATAGLEYPHIVTIVAQSLARFSGEVCVLSIRTPDGNWFEPVASTPANKLAEQTVEANW